MRKDTLYAFGTLALFAWVSMTYFLFVHKPSSGNEGGQRLKNLRNRIEKFDMDLKKVSKQNSELLEIVLQVRDKRKPSAKHKVNSTRPTAGNRPPVSIKLPEADPINSVIPVLMMACNRVSIRTSLESLLKIRKDKKKFPIIVSQDCEHSDTANVIRSFGDQIKFVEQHFDSDVVVPANEKKFIGYFRIARHYERALNGIFNDTLSKTTYHQVIIVEDDLEFAPDFFEYFEATLPILRSDPTLWCVSAWNDNGKRGLIDETKPDLLYRTDFFGGLGWMMTRELWTKELSSKWPKSYWDDWMRLPQQRRERACIRPEIGRTRTFGKVGVSNGLFFDKHLKFIRLNANPVLFQSEKRDLTYLIKTKYDPVMERTVEKETPVVNLKDLRDGQVGHHPAVRLIYRTKESFKAIAKVIGIMDDFKSGVPRMAYKGVVSTMFRGQRVYVAPNLNWKGYDQTW